MLLRAEPTCHSVNYFREVHSVLATDGAFPDYQSAPSFQSELCQILFVVCTVTGKFSPPEARVGLRPLKELAFVLVPKAAVHKNGSLVLAEYQVWAPWQVPLMKSIAESQSKQPLSYQSLRFCILAANAGHAVAALPA